MNIDLKKFKDAIKLVSLNKTDKINLIVKNNTLILCSNGDGFIKKYVKIQNDASEYFKIVLNSETLKLLEKIEGKSCEINVDDFANIKIDKRVIKIYTKINDFIEHSSLKEIEKNTINATELLRLLSVRYAVERSLNTVAWKLLEEMGTSDNLSYLTEMGFGKIVSKDYLFQA